MTDTKTTKTKTCSTCGEDKPLDEFYNRADSPDGKQYRCKLCVRSVERERDDVTLRVSPEVRDAVNVFAADQDITQREATELLLARALMGGE